MTTASSSPFPEPVAVTPEMLASHSITPAATIDEGNNWINLGWGPLAVVSPVDGHTVLGNYSIGGSSTAINQGTNSGAPDHDFFGNPRPRTSIRPKR